MTKKQKKTARDTKSIPATVENQKPEAEKPQEQEASRLKPPHLEDQARPEPEGDLRPIDSQRPWVRGRRLRRHQCGAEEYPLEIFADTERGPAGETTKYYVRWFTEQPGEATQSGGIDLAFQKGGRIATGKAEGLTDAALLAIVADRLGRFQQGPFPCHESLMAWGAVLEALGWLHERTADRCARNVEGLHMK